MKAKHLACSSNAKLQLQLDCSFFFFLGLSEITTSHGSFWNWREQFLAASFICKVHYKSVSSPLLWEKLNTLYLFTDVFQAWFLWIFSVPFHALQLDTRTKTSYCMPSWHFMCLWLVSLLHFVTAFLVVQQLFHPFLVVDLELNSLYSRLHHFRVPF